MVDESDFVSYAEQFEKDEAQRNSNRGVSFTREYETLKWTGLVTNKMKIVRVLGGIPNSPNADKHTARIVQVSWIKGDNGKKFRCILPTREAAADHILWRVISRVNEVTYINRKRVYVNEIKNRDIFDLVNYNGLAVEDPKRKFDKGWEGRQVIVMNVLDREQMDWHRENKHTMLLSRNINVSADGTQEFPDEGVPIYGFYDNIVKSLFKTYSNWEGYDIGIVRLGTTQQPYRIINASAFVAGKIPEVPAYLVPFVSLNSGVTDEEAGWDRYDISKIFGPSTFTKIYNNLKVSIQRIDATLGTKFIQELEFEVEKEKKERAERRAAEEGKSEDQQIEESKPQAIETAAPKAPATKAVPSRAPARTPVNSAALAPEVIEKLKGWSKLTPEQQKMITDVSLDKNGNVTEIKFNTEENLLACPQCRIPAPESFITACPSCGFDFTVLENSVE